MTTITDQLCQTLTALYRSYGYTPFRMRKFEEYGLYLKNRDFLVSDRVLTFTDTDGTLMALKPDVTLSIIRSTRDGQLQKLCYRESVYRPEKPGAPFREITQVGLECMGPVDGYCRLEVVLLALESLRAIGPRYVLCVSHLGLLSRLLDRLGLTGNARTQAVQAISQKNLPFLSQLCREQNIPGQQLLALAGLYGTAGEAVPQLEAIFGGEPELEQLLQLLSGLEAAGFGDQVRLDFSLVNPMNYYNGIVFRGFVEGVPTGILSGGQYDGLMASMGRSSGAIGFALYPDALEQLSEAPDETPAVLLYSPGTPAEAVAAAMKRLTEQGICLRALNEGSPVPDGARIYTLTENEVTADA